MNDAIPEEAPGALSKLTVGAKLRGTIKSLEIFGAFVDIGLDVDALLHISQITPRVKNVSDALSVGQELDVYLLKIHHQTNRVALAMERPPTVAWEDLTNGKQFTGTVQRIERFGAFVDIGCERAGMVHVSEISDGYLSSPNDVLSIGQEVSVWVIKFDRRKRQIDLTMKAPQQYEQVEEEEESEELPTAMEIAFRRALNSSSSDNHRGRRRKKRGRRSREQQEDILTRTLRDHGDYE